MIGQQINHYKILKPLGKGGMGEVFVAEDTRLNRKIALKILPAEMAKDAERRARFEREAKAIAALQHPSIVTIFSVEEGNGFHFITMELVDGKTLSDLLPRDGMPPDKLLELGSALAEAVGAAHKKGITHRDLKPANIMVDTEGRLKVLDFGLAKLADETDVHDGMTSAPTGSVTQEGKVLGTAAYMSPEQAEGKPVDARSDVFSLGVLLYEMATGRRPFQGDTQISTISSILRDQPQSITELNHTLPRHLGRVVKRCLAKAPERRYSSAVDLRNELDELREELATGEIELTPATAAAARRSRVGWPVLVLAVVAVAVVASVVTMFVQRGATPTPVSAPAGTDVTMLTSTGNSVEVAISPDGRYVAHVVAEAGKSSLRVTQSETSSSVEVVPPTEGGIGGPIFSPDGNFIYYQRSERGSTTNLMQVPVLGGAPRKIAERVDSRVTFAPGGEKFAFVRVDLAAAQDLLVVAAMDGSNETVLARKDFPDRYGQPSWSPDGDLIAVAAQYFAGGLRGSVVGVPAAGGPEQPLTAHSFMFVGPTRWFPDGRGLVLRGTEETTFGSSPVFELAYPSGDVRRLTGGLTSYQDLSLTADGETLAVTQGDQVYNLWLIDAVEGASPRRLTRGSRQNDGAGMAWVGNDRLVFGAQRQGDLDIWVVESDGSSPRKLTRGAVSLRPDISPDGDTIVFISTRAGTVNLWTMDVEGGNVTQLTHGEFEVDPEISPDGKWVAYQGNNPGDGRVFKVPIEGGEPVQLTRVRSLLSSFSPDGTKIGVQIWDAEARRWRYAYVPIDGEEHVMLDMPPGGSQASWTPEGEIAFVQETDGVENVWVRPIDGGEARQFTRAQGSSLINVDYSPDGTKLAYIVQQDGVQTLWIQPLDGGSAAWSALQLDVDEIDGYVWSPDSQQIVFRRGRSTSDVVLLRNFR